MSSHNPYEAVRSRPAAPVKAVDEVVTGTINEVMSWVGDDADRAQRALDAEISGPNRKTLVINLESIIAGPVEDRGDEDVEDENE